MTQQQYLALSLIVSIFAGWCPAQAPSPPEEKTAPAGYQETKPLAVSFETLTALCIHPDGHLLAADGPARRIKVISPAGKEGESIALDFAPEAIDVSVDGTIYCGGQGQLAKLSRAGKVLKTVPAPTDVDSSVDVTSRRRARGRPTRISGIAVSGQDVFVAFGSGWSLGSKSKLFRFDLNWENPKLLDEGLRGCCQRCDITARDGKLYLAENSAHRVVVYDREGNKLQKWGTRSRTGLEGFGSCCNPMNLCFDKAGTLYTAESGLGRIKQYSPDGKLQALAGHVDVERFTRAGHTAASCSNIAIAVTPDAQRIYVMDFKERIIRVLEKTK